MLPSRSDDLLVSPILTIVSSSNMDSESKAPKCHKTHGQLLQIRHTFKSLGVDSVRKQNAIGYEKHEAPKNIDNRDVVQDEIAKWEERAIKQ